uniref:PDZ domain-containing protein n=1 Tax=Alexandrium catenella TaxID=2925 RepID=A0A7S1QVZ0_ALECA
MLWLKSRLQAPRSIPFPLLLMGAGAGAKAEPVTPPGKPSTDGAARRPPQPSCRSTLDIVFSDQSGELRTVTFTKKPLGFEITQGKVPIIVRGVCPGSWSQRLGVQVGWTVVKVAGEEMGDLKWEDAMHFLVRSVDALPQDIKVVQPTAEERSVEMTFDTGATDASSKTLVFMKRPLGLEFEVEAPIRITKVADKSVSQRLGVQVGWRIIKVNGEDLDGKTFAEQFAQLKKSVKALPNVYASIAPHAGLTVNSDGTMEQSERPVGPHARDREL